MYIVKMAMLDQIYHHRKEWSYRYFKDLFGNGMAVGTKWEHVMSLTLIFPNKHRLISLFKVLTIYLTIWIII